MRPVGDAMAIAMRDVEKIDRKILVADLQIFATSVVANVGIFRCFSGAVLARKYARKYLRAIFARKFVKNVANMGYLLHLRPHLRAQKHLLPANLLSACKSSSFFAEMVTSRHLISARPYNNIYIYVIPK
mgnify:CR=1 FL=1